MSTRRALVMGLCLLALHAPSIAAAQQTPAGVAPGATPTETLRVSAADSAALARERFRAATAARARGDLDSAMRAITQAIAAWPTQPAYAGTMALIAARRSDVPGLVQAIAMLTEFEAGGGVDRDTAVAHMSTQPAVQVALARWRTATADRANSTVYATFSDSAMFPEGMDVGAYRHGVRGERTARDDRRASHRRHRTRAAARRIRARRGDACGTHRHRAQRAVGNHIRHPATRRVHAGRLRPRVADPHPARRWHHRRSYALPAAPGGYVLGDVAISPTGDVLFTDSQHATLFVLRTDADTLVSYTHARFRSLQGVAPSADGSGAHVADYSHGLLYVELRTGRVVRVADAAGTTTLGIDGIVRTGRDIIAVQNGMVPARAVRLTLDQSGRRVVRAQTVDRNGTIADEPTIGAMLGDAFLYVANSQWEKYDARGQRMPGTSLAPPVILRVLLPKAPDLGRRRDPLHLRARDLLRRALRNGRSETRR